MKMTSKHITQETFDAAVRENIEEFEMGPEEAVKEAVEQFESQGVDLGNIVKMTPKVSADGPQEPTHDILQALDDLQESMARSHPQEVSAHLARFCEQCKQQKACRFLAAEKGAYPILLATWKLATTAFPDNPSILSDLCSTLSRLAVRNEFCQEVVDLGGLNVLVALLADCSDHQDLVKQVLSALRAIAGNDDVKDAIVRAGGTESIVSAMTRHLASPQVCEQSCAALCVLALRKPENSQIIVEGGGALAALQAMKAHPQEVGVQKQACMLIRNLVARSQTFSQPILDLGAEALISRARATHRDCEDVAKAALRDLGCHVELQELWTGQKGNLAP
ncbi:PREDICTED: armadillo repeat-containing protein 6 isoform X3 [Lipotes vexillifer]|uniref:Armadillo repeat-containing protein 6 isoform X3 n=1 Tax=Lipotes vexillifer TaxID=118797 RepID=A0A340XLY5_LIPVE|nr:PREDICTED: armadillo repeat-containing protein 6 isoform X3 [Lipotes vexillifer]